MTAAADPAARVGPLRERIVSRAVALTAEVGWAGVTMARLADGVGVSRQTVYNELAARPAWPRR